MFGAAVTGVSQFHVADQASPNEIIAVTNVSGTTWTVTRGAEGTTPVAHSAGFTVYQVVSTGGYAQLRAVDWLNVVTQYGADPTGAADSTAAIQNAINAVPGSGGVVYFPAGVYQCSGTLIVDKSYVTLQGAGYGFATTITVPSSAVSRTAAIIIGNTAPVNQCTVRDLAVKSDGGGGAVKAGTGHGIVVAGDNCLVENVIVRYCSGDAFHFGQDLLNTAVQTTIASGSNGQALPQATINVAATTGFASSGELIIRKSSGACAYVSYTGTSGGNQFTGCSSSFGGSSFTLATGDVVIPVTNQFDTTVINTYAMQFGGNGYYSDWTYFSCEWLDARAEGAASKPGSTTGQNGFLIYGGTQKFTMCHAYFCAGNGLQIGDAHSFTAQDIVVTGGEWESNTSSGILVTNNQGAVVIGSGAAFYGQGLSSTGQDIFLGGTAVNVRIDHCMFIKTTATSIAQNIYTFSSTYCTVAGCVFSSGGVSWNVKNILLDGASGAVSNFQIHDNRMLDSNSSALAVQVKGAVTGCSIHSNITDADITEVTSGSTPSGNSYWDNTFIAGQNGALTVVGAVAVPQFPGPADWINVVSQYGADPSGTTDSTTAIQNAINALPATGGVVYLPAGTYKVSSTLTNAVTPTYIAGAGRWATQINFTGTGDCLRMYNPAGSGTAVGGGVHDLTVDGTSAGNSSAGLHIGDGSNYELDLVVQNFSGTSSIGVHFDNTIWWTEKLHGTVYAENNTQNVVFDVTSPATTVAAGSNGGTISGIATWGAGFGGNGVLDVASTTGFPTSGTINVAASGPTTAVVTYTGKTSNTLTGCAYVSGSPSGTVATGGAVTLVTSTISFGYLDLHLWVNATQANQDGVVLQNGARIYHAALAIRGNFTGSSSAQSSYVLRLTGTAPAGHLQAGAGSQIIRSRLDITVEANAGTGTNAPGTIRFNTSAVNVIQGCYGVMDFGSGGISFAASNLGISTNANTLWYQGIVNGDNNLNPGAITLPLSIGGQLYSAALADGSNGNIFVASGDFFKATLSASITVNLNASTNPAVPRRITIVYQQAAAGGPFTVTWPHNGSPTNSAPTVLWAGGAAPTMSAGANAVDVYKLETTNGATWYGEALQNVS